jgi:hypothetical protein
MFFVGKVLQVSMTWQHGKKEIPSEEFFKIGF